MSGLAIMLTRRCNMACAHCSVESGPKAGTTGPALAELLRVVRDAAGAGVQYINVTGGEPMLRERAALEVVRECRRLGIAVRITTNGFWGRTPERARRTLDEMLGAGLSALTVSYDRFHAAFQGPEPVVNIARAAAARDFHFEVNVTRLADDGEIGELIAPFDVLPNVHLRFYDVQPLGAARDLPGDAMRSETEGFCNACGVAALTDDGRVTACNGPSYFMPPGHPLAIGSLRDTPLAELVARHREDPILDTIRTQGPGGLRATLLTLPGFEDFPFRDRYAGMCDLCHHVTSSPEAVAALRAALSSPERAAERVARKKLIDVERRGRTLTREHANADGFARVILALAAGETPDPDIAGRVLGRADVDWRARAEALITAGLARQVLSRLEEPLLARWAPALFGSLIRRAAAVDEERETAQREALERLAAILRDLRSGGTIVGGAALWPWGRSGSEKGRAVGAVEIVVSDRTAARAARAGAGNGSGPSQIAVRMRIAPAPWGMPDSRFLQAALPISDPALAGLRRLAPADALVCTLVGASAAGLRLGLEAAWDAWAAMREGPLDIERVAEVVDSLPASRAFWVPARVLGARAGLPIPEALLSRAPDDLRQRRLENVAARRLFRARPSKAMAEWTFQWAWPLLASGSASDFRRRLPSAVVRAARDLPAAWSEMGAGGVVSAVREARRIRGAWTSNSEPG
ncbi:MAG TPA: radical SAM protein [Gemmatimonadota bacterium]|nr:radical SAM protein [Gemmatimonadota bacterium]